MPRRADRWHADRAWLRRRHVARFIWSIAAAALIIAAMFDGLMVMHEMARSEWMPRHLPGVLVALWLGCAASLGRTEQPVDYLRDVKPLLKQRCYACHGALKQEAGLRLDTASSIRRGGDSGAAVQPGQPNGSLLLQRVSATDASERMPPEGEPLTPEQITWLTGWIAAGAIAPQSEIPEEDPRDHWAFKRPIKTPPPAVTNSGWVGNSIDAFIEAQRETRGLVPLPPAEKHVLLRRVYLDLIGLPPTRQELHAFLSDPREDAYERVVERLLASPQYGERWGRHWMDVWRYSDWYGRRGVPDVLNSYAQIWRWRDWIVRSLNEDKGYDRMVMEMLAADELAPEDDENIVATGFVVRNFYRWNYNTWMKDNIEHTGKAFLALTLNCCHCHDHKYDPITQEEYFRFRAFFEPIEIRHDRVAGEPDPGPYPKYSYGAAYKPITSGMVRICDERLDSGTFMYSGGEERNIIAGKAPIPPGAPATLGGELLIERVELPPAAWYPGLKPFVQQEEIGSREQTLAAAQASLLKTSESAAAAEQRLAQVAANSAEAQAAKDELAIARLTLQADQANVDHAQAELAAIRARIEADRIRYVGAEGNADEAARLASAAERQTAFQTARAALARTTRDLAAAEAKAAKDSAAQAEVAKLQPQVAAARESLAKAEQQLAADSTDYTPLSPQYARQSTGRRVALARWLASHQNPLTARVAVNHIWLRHFGRAIVETTENFGRNGARPSHPELLNWLAVELMESGWSMKHVHRLIVTSNTYRLTSSTHSREHPNFTIDADNRWLWRFPTLRMEAEVLRDSILHAAGELDLTMGGKEIDQMLGLSVPRRSIYFDHHGEGRMPFLDLFDAANPCDCYHRSTSVRPQQALAMANSELPAAKSTSLARILAEESDPATDETFVSIAFEQVLARKPSAAEQLTSQRFLDQQRDLLQSSGQQPADATARARASLVQALFSHHDFVTIR